LVISCISLNSSAQNEAGFDLGISGTFNSTWILKQNNYCHVKLVLSDKVVF
jgi:hypothetical protein